MTVADNNSHVFSTIVNDINYPDQSKNMILDVLDQSKDLYTYILYKCKRKSIDQRPSTKYQRLVSWS